MAGTANICYAAVASEAPNRATSLCNVCNTATGPTYQTVHAARHGSLGMGAGSIGPCLLILGETSAEFVQQNPAVQTPANTCSMQSVYADDSKAVAHRQ